ncbi:BREX-1 system adenine-specific DNA-methyltransferase PglX [Methylomonas sp. OY6]|uniref:site-specific DNA-methyltransferase (adenine-specific) n=1 Tax=Methylomonas defluvii TaxID=3045149 RepID=A0ABU4UCV6_9GAMM|nr:BREX-1 system adenine-specific DNA-methyltransferase PglX [Methylomonas sp. OY6]MDX8126777.1 BREX-1 system adenine-specific DNA-methyltransferase PglX [Methylomonas sp. OY6]
METTKLRRFAQYARRSLIEQVSAKLKLVLSEDSAARRESVEAVRKLEDAIHLLGKDQVIERVAYIWFNRFCALRFMDVNRYNRVGIVSPADPGQFQPEILAEAKMGHIDDEMVHDKVRQQIFALLDGKAPSRDPQGEAYRLLVVAACNSWNKAMPFLFQRIEDYTELLMPDDLLSGNSILAYTREAMTPDACEDVEVIGWLYQFYISEKKDEVFDGLKKNKKITPENIPAATQLFTPHWIVRYLVENSLGRLWLLNRPGSKLAEQMDYYIKPEQPETDFLRISKPEEIKICDPACGSGHMLTYAFDLLYAIYEEEGYEPAEIPEKILTHNLYGIEIDERAGELAAFALTMKSRAKHRRFFNKEVKPNICVLQNIDSITHEPEWLKTLEAMQNSGVDRSSLIQNITLFAEANNFGSLLRPTLTTEQAQKAIAALTAYDESVKTPMIGHRELIDQCKTALLQADYLSQKYHIVIANPPYMGGKGMNGRMAAWLKDNYTDVKSDLFSAFMVRNTELALPKGQLGFMSPFVWMFISSYEKLRTFLINQKTITSLVQLEYSGFDGATVPICTFTVENAQHPDFKGGYVRLSDFRGSDNQGPRTLEAIKNHDCGWFYRASTVDFKKIPGCPIAYWVSDKVREMFSSSEKLVGDVANPNQALVTGSTDLYIRKWHELPFFNIGFGCNSRDESKTSKKRWFPYNKGGDFRNWYGNLDHVVDWENDGYKLQTTLHPSGKRIWAHNFVLDSIFNEALVWSKITSGKPCFRYSPEGFLYDDASGVCSFENGKKEVLLGLFCSKVNYLIQKLINPTLNIQPANLRAVPLPKKELVGVKNTVNLILNISKYDWNSYETSWDFTSLPLLNPDYRQPTLKVTYQKLRSHWREMTVEMQRLEEENNRIFIEAYGLQDELTSEVPLNEITLTCNPHYRYGKDKSEDELEALLLADTMRELISYAVGCMFGRYALDKPGLILTNQGETIMDYLKQIPEPSFPADDDNVIPMLDGDWFTDDITERFRQFLRVAFGEGHYEENLKFVEQALNVKGKREYTIRDYFLGEFYTDHVKRYKKRPIYWLFSSPKGSFNALIYMHRYRSDTVSVVLNDYLREFRTKLTAHKNHLEAVSISGSAAQGEKTKALKEIEKINKMIAELEEYEREVLYPLATQQIDIDLDDGVKFNYVQFGAALKKIVGLDAQED